jgi:hypothetical protein
MLSPVRNNAKWFLLRRETDPTTVGPKTGIPKPLSLGTRRAEKWTKCNFVSKCDPKCNLGSREHLSEWRKRGYQKWLAHRNMFDESNALGDNAE